MDNRSAEPDKTPSVFNIPPSLILPATKGHFSVFLRQDNKLVLYSKKGETFTREHRDRLQELGVRQVFVAREDKSGYEYYIQKNIGKLLADETIPAEVRSHAWMEAATNMAKDVFDRQMPKALSKKRFGKIKSLIENSTRFFTDPEALKELSGFITKGFRIYHHSIGAMIFTASILATLDVDDELMTSACVGALLHDVGKLKIDREILGLDPEEMTQGEQTIIRTHPVLGVNVCQNLPLNHESVQMILFHHEREDGTGYPIGISGPEIPIYVKALTVANAYDNLVRTSPWRPALPPFEALQQMKSNKKAYDLDMLRRLILVLANAKITN